MAVSPYILLCLTCLFWSFNFVLGKVLIGTVPPAAISFFRWFFPLIYFLSLYGREILTHKKMFLENWPLVLMLGTTGFCLNSVCVFEAIRYTTTINASFINAFNPVMIAITGFLLYRYPVSAGQAAGFLLSFAGVLCIMFKGDPGLITRMDINVGDLFMVASIMAWSLHTVFYKQRAKDFPVNAMFAAMIIGGELATLPMLLMETVANHGAWISRIGWIHLVCILCLGIFPSVLAYQFWHAALKRASVNQVAIFQYLIPVFTTIISVLFLGEHLRLFHVLGGALIFAGVIMVVNLAPAVTPPG